ncbi:hypothetical protein [Fibrella aquatilis]|uniref:YD repeat-containing protein n=1 Tax=Fibrella aquatilis TaxID=2817059 RepID=A0A939G7J7_9BACT|nr:hypothetical protein [Fibrella aquatilis]MBO0932465.1 hypothetical protein [Fibrella aquatilis]
MNRSVLLCFVGLLLLVGCHQEPELSGAAIPQLCRIGLVEVIQEGGNVRRQGYLYNNFGSLTQYYEENQNGRILTQTYTYDTTHYAISREDKTAGGTVRYTYAYEGSPKRIVSITPTQGSGTTWAYAYDGDRLKTITKTGGGTTEVLTYQADGKLASRTKTGERYAVDPATGYVTSYTHTDGVVETFTVNAQGNHLVKTYNEPALSKFTSSTYTYITDDDKKFYGETQLLFRGIPNVTDGGGKPGLLTAYVLNQSIQNVLRLTQQGLFRYTYNSSGYALGYACTTGERAKFYYTNCPAP